MPQLGSARKFHHELITTLFRRFLKDNFYNVGHPHHPEITKICAHQDPKTVVTIHEIHELEKSREGRDLEIVVVTIHETHELEKPRKGQGREIRHRVNIVQVRQLFKYSFNWSTNRQIVVSIKCKLCFDKFFHLIMKIL